MDRPIRVAYFDLGFSREEYGLQPTRYGGGAVAARYLKEDTEVDLYVLAPEEAFANMGSKERLGRCIILPPDLREALKRGWGLDNVINDSFDIILHPHTCETLNRGSLKAPVVHFAGFAGDCGHPGNDYILLYDDTFRAQFGERPKYVRIGKPVPSTFTERVKEPFVFQCSRHDDHMNTISVAQQCLANGIKGVFAGPIHNGYPLMRYIDGKTTIYLGEIDEPTKLDLCARATLFTLNHVWDKMPFNQSVIEAQGVGTPIWANGDCPFMRRYLKVGVNGWDSRDMPDLPFAFAQASFISQRACWEAASAYSVPVMVDSFKQAFREIVYEWRVSPKR